MPTSLKFLIDFISHKDFLILWSEHFICPPAIKHNALILNWCSVYNIIVNLGYLPVNDDGSGFFLIQK